jgi:hypothetical protein
MSRPLKGRAKRADAAEAGPRPEGARSVADLERECADLRRDLAAAQARIADLEALRRRAIDRVEWAIDSVHTLID